MDNVLKEKKTTTTYQMDKKMSVLKTFLEE